jgi:hypothetical protein
MSSKNKTRNPPCGSWDKIPTRPEFFIADCGEDVNLLRLPANNTSGDFQVGRCVSTATQDIGWGRCTVSLCCEITTLYPGSQSTALAAYRIHTSVPADVSIGVANQCDKPSRPLTRVCTNTKECSGRTILNERPSALGDRFLMLAVKSPVVTWPWTQWIINWDEVTLDVGCPKCGVKYWLNPCWSPIASNDVL